MIKEVLIALKAVCQVKPGILAMVLENQMLSGFYQG